MEPDKIQHRRRFEDARPLFRITITISQNTSSGIVPPDATSVMHPKPSAQTQMTAAQDRRTALHCNCIASFWIQMSSSPAAVHSPHIHAGNQCIAYIFFTELVVCCQLTSHQSGMHCAGLFSLKPGSVCADQLCPASCTAL